MIGGAGVRTTSEKIAELLKQAQQDQDVESISQPSANQDYSFLISAFSAESEVLSRTNLAATILDFIIFLCSSSILRFDPQNYVHPLHVSDSTSSDATFSVKKADLEMAELYKKLSSVQNGRFLLFRSVAGIAFTVNASSAASERVFSCAGLVDGPLRQRLSDEKQEKVTVLAYYLNGLEKRGKIDDFVKKIREMYPFHASHKK